MGTILKSNFVPGRNHLLTANIQDNAGQSTQGKNRNLSELNSPTTNDSEIKRNDAAISKQKSNANRYRLEQLIPTPTQDVASEERSRKKPRLDSNIANPSDIPSFGISARILNPQYLKSALYPKMPLNSDTQVGETHANRISINDKLVGIAAQFPKNDQLPEFIKSLFDESSILVVLAAKQDFDSENSKAMASGREPKISAYFRPDSEQTHGDYKVSPASSSSIKRVGEYEAEVHTLHITSTKDNQTRDIPVLHISDWVNKSIPQDPETLLSLINEMRDLEEPSKLNQNTSDAKERSPVVHCLAGQGSTGIVMAAKIMQENPGMSLKEIVPEMRECRPSMLESEEKNFPNETIKLFEKFAELLKTPSISAQRQTIATAFNPQNAPLPNTPNNDSPVFLSFKSWAEKTLVHLKRELQRDKDKIITIETMLKAAYDIYAYPSLASGDMVDRRLQPSPAQKRASILHLDTLSSARNNSIIVLPQRHSESKNHTIITPGQSLELAEKSNNPERELELVFKDAYLILAANWSSRPATGEDGIESRLSINVNPQYADALSDVLADLCTADGVCQCKVLGPSDHGIRSETGILYLSQANPERAADLSEEIHVRLLERLHKEFGPDINVDNIYANPPVATQIVRPGISYSEKTQGAPINSSSGAEKAKVAALVIADHLTTRKDFGLALNDRLKTSGYSIFNPAFSHRPHYDAQSVLNRVTILQSKTPSVAGN